MSILLETTFGDIVLDLDVDGSPALCKNILKLAKARYYTNTLIYNVVPGKYGQMGDPKGDGTGGCSIYGLIDTYQSSPADNTNFKQQPSPDVTKSKRRFLQSHGRSLSSTELNQKGTVIAMEIGNVQHTIGSQFLITLSDDNGLQDLISSKGEVDNERTTVGGGNDIKQKSNNNRYLSLGTVAEDTQHVLSKLNRAYCDDNGRPYADIRILRALVIHDPFDDPPGMDDLLKRRGVVVIPSADGDNNGGQKNDNNSSTLENDFKDGYPLAPLSPTYDKPPEEAVPVRIQADDTTLFATAGWDDDDINGSREYEDEDEEEDEAAREKRLELQEKQEEEWRKKQDTSRAVMLEMLGDRPDAEIEAPENVLFVCKLNPFTNDEDLELIFSRFDQEAKAEIIRDPDTGASLQYAFVEFTNNEACNEAYLKMNNALVDDRRIKVDFSQSVANVWDRYNKRYRRGDKRSGIDRGFMDGGGRGRGRGGRGRGGRGPGRFGNRNHPNDRARDQTSYHSNGNGQQRNDMQATRHHMRQDPRSNSRSRSPRRDNNREERRRRSRSDSGSRHERRSHRRSRSRSDDSSDNRRRKKHKHRHKDSSRKKRSRSRDRDRERKKHKKHKHDRKHSRRHDDKHHRRHRDRSDRSRSR